MFLYTPNHFQAQLKEDPWHMMIVDREILTGIFFPDPWPWNIHVTMNHSSETTTT